MRNYCKLDKSIAGTYFAQAREYLPSAGRFAGEDRIKHGNNWYAYCSGNPLSFIDPTGLTDESGNISEDSDTFWENLWNNVAGGFRWVGGVIVDIFASTNPVVDYFKRIISLADFGIIAANALDNINQNWFIHAINVLEVGSGIEETPIFLRAFPNQEAYIERLIRVYNNNVFGNWRTANGVTSTPDVTTIEQIVDAGLMERFISDMVIWDRPAFYGLAGNEAVRLLISGSALLTP